MLSNIDSIGTSSTKLIVMRGNVAAGKSTTARELRAQSAQQLALVEQDYLRKIVIGEHDVPGGLTPALISQTVRFLLDRGRHVLLEGVLPVALYGDMLLALIAAHKGQTSVFYMDVSLEETVRRHATRPKANEFGAKEMTGWYLPNDQLKTDGEVSISGLSTLEASVALIGKASGLIA